MLQYSRTAALLHPNTMNLLSVSSRSGHAGGSGDAAAFSQGNEKYADTEERRLTPMKMENANVEFVTFEAQDVIATSLWIGQNVMMNLSKNTVMLPTSPYSSYKVVELATGEPFSVPSGSMSFKISPVYSISGGTGTKDDPYLVGLTVTDSKEIAGTDVANYIGGTYKGQQNMIALLAWLNANGIEQ